MQETRIHLNGAIASGEATSQIKILWQKSTARQAVLNLPIAGRSIEADTTLQRQLVGELHELLSTLFSDAQMLLVEPLTRGYSNCRVLKVQPFYGVQGSGREMVVKFGDKREIEQERACYKKYIQNFVGDGCSTVLTDHRTTAHLGGIAYTFLGSELQKMQDFGKFYLQATPLQIHQALDNLFQRTCRLWYASTGPLQPLDLTEDYGRLLSCSPKQLLPLVAAYLPEVSVRKTLHFPTLGDVVERTFPNPFAALEQTPALIRPTYVGTTHGDFNMRNIFIGPAEQAWLIDFQQSGRGHILRDVALLDTVIRFQLLFAKDATLSERLVMEEQLCSIQRFSEVGRLNKYIMQGSPALNKAYQSVVHLRALARWIVDKNPANDMSEYYIALLYITLNALRFPSLDEVQREHALLSASLLINKLGLHRE